MRALGCGQDALALGKHDRRVEHLALLHCDGAQIAVVIELGDDGAHAVISESARMVGRGHEAAAQRVHFRKGSDLGGVAEVIGELAARQRRTARGLDADKLNVVLALQPLAHVGRDEAAEVGAAAHAADDDVGRDAVFIERRLALQADDGLVQQDVIEHGAEDVAAIGCRDRLFHRLGDRAAQRAARAGELGEDLPARLGRIGGRGNDVGAVGTDDLLAVWLLLGGHLDHVHVEVQPEECRRHGERRAPLPRARLGRNRRQPLLLCVVRLRRRGVELVRAGRVVALKFVVNFGGRVQQLFQEIRSYKGRGTEGAVEVADAVGNADVLVRLVEFLIDALVAEHGTQVVLGAGLHGRGIDEGRVLRLHVRFNIIPCLRHLLFRQIDLVRDLLGCHGVTS